MLFQQIYNWFQYKTLPPSFFAKNRLLIEREGKRNRIFNKVGLTFQNSKWTNYERNTLNFHFIPQFAFLVLGFLLISILIYFNAQFSNTSFFVFTTTCVNYFLWLAIDWCDYFVLFVIWFSLGIVTFTQQILQAILFPALSPSVNFTNLLKGNANQTQELPSFINYNNFDHSSVMSNSLIEELRRNRHPIVLGSVFLKPATDNQNWVLPTFLVHYNFIIQFLTSQFQVTLHSRSIMSNFGIHPVTMSIPSLELNPLVLLFTNLNQQRTLWNTSFIKRSYLGSSCNAKSASDSYVFFDRNFILPISRRFDLETFRYELQLVRAQDTLADTQKRVSRWLYNYSLLHRKTIQDLQRISNIKRLLNDNFLLTLNSNRNLWTSEISNLNIATLQPKLRALNKTFFNLNTFETGAEISSLFQSNSLNANETSVNSVRNLETSFSFMIKRIFLFDNLGTDLWCNRHQHQFAEFYEHQRVGGLWMRESLLQTRQFGEIFRKLQSTRMDWFSFEIAKDNSRHIQTLFNESKDMTSWAFPYTLHSQTDSSIWRKHRRLWLLIANDERIFVRRHISGLPIISNFDEIRFYNK